MSVQKSKVNGFDIFNYIFMILVCISTLYPFLYLLSLSFSPADISFAHIRLIPPNVTLANYKKVFSSHYILTGFQRTLIRTVLGTFISLIAVLLTAYPLSKKHFPNRSFWTGFIVFTMFFSGGLIPSYLLMKRLGLMNKMAALILPGLIPTYTMVIVRNYMMSLPSSLEESAKIDGANDILILFKIFAPLCIPIIATATLWISVSHWNAWFDSLIYISDNRKQVLQVILRRIVLEGTQEMMELNTAIDDPQAVSPESIKAATIMVVTIPIVLVYPFVQKHFMKGIMIGSLKG